MIETIRRYARADPALTGETGIGSRVLEAMAQTKRHLFVPERYRSLAYDDRPLPIGHDQTISQPYVVALMTDLARVPAGGAVLEIGTGSGYQAAVLAQIAAKVCTIEIVAPLGERARDLLKELGSANVRVRIGDGYKGWPECGPFDSVVVTAALGHVPPALIEQLKVGGTLVMPVGSPAATQRLTVVEKIGPDRTTVREAGYVRFVTFTRPKK
jgi:protein-L-isoaspartate(D-aspartate) O-methyltransferase